MNQGKRKHKRLWRSIALSGVLICACATHVWAKPEIFSDYSIEQAQQLAQKDHKFVLLDFTATWCPPCRKMESTTWVDNKIQDWVKENAIAVQIDVDKNRKASSALSIEAMPTVILFPPQNPSKEFGRQVGYMSPSELLDWLESAKTGKPTEPSASKSQNQDELWKHLGQAQQLKAAGNNADALVEYIWLWNNIDKKDENVGQLRISMLPVELKSLCAIYPAAKVPIAEMRDNAEKSNNRADWIILNSVLEDNQRTLTWFDMAKVDANQRDTIEQNYTLIEPVLFSNARWSDAAKYLYPQPLVKINEYYKRAQEMKKGRPDTEVSQNIDPFPGMVLLVYGAYVGAGREAEAQKIADECLRLDDTPSMREGLSSMAKGLEKARTAQKSKVK